MPTNSGRDMATQGRVSHDKGFSLIPETVIGSTVSSINTLSAAVETEIFAFCAGSAVVLAAVNSQLGLDQRLFCVNPDVLPAQATPSYYNPATPSKAAGNRGALFSNEFTSSSTPGDHNTESPSRIRPAHRARCVTSVSLSPSGKHLAIGEAGYRPRILVFSTDLTATIDAPVACLTEHTFGVRAMAFSHDSRWLCSLGDLHDGGLFLWSINPKSGALRLDSSNRCTTAETIAWMGTSVVSVGTRNVKVWRLERPPSPSKARRGLDAVADGSTASPVPRTFAGRNCLLGSLKDAIFSCVVGISDELAVLGTQDGAVCLLDDANRSQHLYQVSQKNYRITSITFDRSSRIVWLGGEGVGPDALALDVLLTAKLPSAALEGPRSLDVNVERKNQEDSGVMALCYVENRLITFDSSRDMRIYDTTPKLGASIELSTIQVSPGHDSAILGVVSLSRSVHTQADFLTYSEKGHIFHWSWNGTCMDRYIVKLEQPLHGGSEELNEIRVVRTVPTGEMLFAGDKAGVLHLLSMRGEAKAVAKAHDGEVLDLALHEIEGNVSLAASCGRDRTIQIFWISEDECLLQQSIMHEHTGPIRKVVFADNGNFLASMALDRTVVLHRRVLRADQTVAFISTKVVNLKASPMTMSLLPGITPTLLVSAMDRCIRKISVADGQVTSTIKMSDHVDTEPVTISRFSVGIIDWQPKSTSVLVGFSSADRSIRSYDTETGSLLALEYGQTAVSDLAFIKAKEPGGEIIYRIVSTGLDGTIMVWKMTPKAVKYGDGNGLANLNSSKAQTPSAMRPLRRVLSKTEIAEHQRSLDIQVKDKTVLSRNLSPSRLRRKTSKYANSDAPEVSDPNLSINMRSAQTSAGGGTPRNKFKHVSPPLSPNSNLQSRQRRSSLDERHVHTTVQCPRNINAAARQLRDVLEDFRQQLTVSKESLSTDKAQVLQKELHATLNILTQPTRQGDQNGTKASDQSFDEFLARMIDDRLALRFKSEDHTNTRAGSKDTEPSASATNTAG